MKPESRFTKKKIPFVPEVARKAEFVKGVGPEGRLIESLSHGSAYVPICRDPASVPDENRLSTILDEIVKSGGTNLRTLAAPKAIELLLSYRAFCRHQVGPEISESLCRVFCLPLSCPYRRSCVVSFLRFPCRT